MFENGIPIWISRAVGYSLVGRKGGFAKEVDAIFDSRKATEYASSQAVQDLQLARVKSLLQHAQEYCPYYTRVFREVGFDPFRMRNIDELRVVPRLTKHALINHRDELISRKHRIEDLNLNSTGGSTGLTVNYYQDRNWLTHQVAGERFYNSIAGWEAGCRAAYLWGAPSDNDKAKEGWKAGVKNLLMNSRLFDSFDMSEDRMADYHHQLTRFAPDVMVCYAGSAYTLAKFLLAKGWRADYPRRAIITSAETLTPEMRRTIEAAFSARVFNRYGSREVGVIGAECARHEGLHVNELDLFVESDTSNNPEGELLVTSLQNFGMPLIRYEIGDVGALSSEPCACGRAGDRISRLFGRTTDFFSTRDGRKIHGEYFTHLFYGLDAVRQFQLVQETLDSFVLRIVRNPEFWVPAVEDRIRAELQKVFGEASKLEIEYVDAIPVSASGKYRFTISKV